MTETPDSQQGQHDQQAFPQNSSPTMQPFGITSQNDSQDPQPIQPMQNYARTVSNTTTFGVQPLQNDATQTRLAQLEQQNQALDQTVRRLSADLRDANDRVEHLQMAFTQLKENVAVLVNAFSDQAEVVQAILRAFN